MLKLVDAIRDAIVCKAMAADLTSMFAHPDCVWQRVLFKMTDATIIGLFEDAGEQPPDSKWLAANRERYEGAQ